MTLINNCHPIQSVIFFACPKTIKPIPSIVKIFQTFLLFLLENY